MIGLLIETKLRARAELRRRGYSRSKINDMIDGLDDDVITVSTKQCGATPPVGDDSDKTFWQKLVEWLEQQLRGKANIGIWARNAGAWTQAYPTESAPVMFAGETVGRVTHLI